MADAIRIGLMGLGQVGRQIYKLCMTDPRFDVVAISDIGHPEILTHLLNKTLNGASVSLDANYLVGDSFASGGKGGKGGKKGTSKTVQTRLLTADQPNEIPWDVFGVDTVIDATGQFRSRNELSPHISNGAGRVVASTLPEGDLDRVVLYGVNEALAEPADQIISAGSASTTATALALQTISRQHEIAHATMTSVHAYTSDQSLQDYAGADYRRSRSGAENIIPNLTPALTWVQKALPEVAGKMTAYALNVPVQTGSMLDITVSLTDAIGDESAIKALFVEAAQQQPTLFAATQDPIVSSDVRGCSQSLLVDLQGSMKAGEKMFKLLAWHETLGHASRILDVAHHYHQITAAK